MASILIFTKNKHDIPWQTYAQREADLRKQVPEDARAAYEQNLDRFETAKNNGEFAQLPGIVKEWVDNKTAATRALNLDGPKWKVEEPNTLDPLSWDNWVGKKAAAECVTETLINAQQAPITAINIGRAPIFDRIENNPTFGQALGAMVCLRHIYAQGTAMEHGTFKHLVKQRIETIDLTDAVQLRMGHIQEVIDSGCQTVRLRADDLRFVDAFTREGYHLSEPAAEEVSEKDRALS